METILGLLLILLPAIFKLVEKKLKASGKTEAADQMHEWSEIFGEKKDEWKEDEDESPSIPEAGQSVFSEPVMPEPVVPKPEPVRHKAVAPKPSHMKVRKSSSKPMLVEEEPKKKEKIDPKKLVIYSEIMKPKFKN